MKNFERFLLVFLVASAKALTTPTEAANNYLTWLDNQAVLPFSYMFFPFHQAFQYNDAAYWRTANNTIIRNGTSCGNNLFVTGPYGRPATAIRPSPNGVRCDHVIEIGTPVFGPSVNNGWTIAMWVKLGVNASQNIVSFHHPSSIGEAFPRIYFTVGLNIVGMRGTQSTLVQTNVNCYVSNEQWAYVAMSFDKTVSKCYSICNGMSNWASCNETSMMLSQKLVISRGISGDDAVISCLQMYNKALNSSEMDLAKEQCRLFDTLFDGVGDGTCHINPTSDGWSCDTCDFATTSPLCLGIPTTAPATTTTPLPTTAGTTLATTPPPVKAPDDSCSPTCDPRSSVCTTAGLCHCLARFHGQMCDKIVGNPLSDPKTHLSHHSYLTDGKFDDNWHFVGNSSKSPLQRNNAIRLTNGTFEEIGIMISKLEFPFSDFTINATFEINFSNAQDAEGLTVAVVSNQSIHWNSMIRGIDIDNFSGLAVTFRPANESIDLYMSYNMTSFGSSSGSSISTADVQLGLKGRFHVGMVVRRGYRIWLEQCTMQNCQRLISAFNSNDRFPIEASLEPPVLLISAFSGASDLVVDVIDFRAYSLTPHAKCKCKPRRSWCFAENECLCKPGWTGSTCFNQICGNTTCPANGYCKDHSKSQCVCFDKWRTGANCDEPFCDCENEGRCALPWRKCQCKDGSSSPDCNAH